MTIARQKMLTLGNTEIEQGKFREAEDVFAELDRRLAEDDASPDDTVAWEAIKEEALARWKAMMRPFIFEKNIHGPECLENENKMKCTICKTGEPA